MAIMGTRFLTVFAAATVLASTVPAYAQNQMTIVSFGGALAEAQRKTYFEPFAKATGVKVLEDDWGGQMAKLRAMVQSGNVTWDVIDLSDGQTDRACDEGLIEPLDIAMFGGADKFIPNSVHRCAIPTLVASIVIGYNAKKFTGGEPSKLADFWDVKRFPGPRAMKKWPKHNYELALLADGVAPGEIYKLLATPAGVQRALKKLDEIKPHVKVWFDNWAQPQQLLASGEVVMSTATNGRLGAVQSTNPELKIIWDRQGIGMDLWAVVKGSKNKASALKFIEFASRPEIMAEFAKHIQYGPPVKAAMEKMSPELARLMPTAPDNMKTAWNIDARFWGDHQDALEAPFQAWLSK